MFLEIIKFNDIQYQFTSWCCVWIAACEELVDQLPHLLGIKLSAIWYRCCNGS